MRLATVFMMLFLVAVSAHAEVDFSTGIAPSVSSGVSELDIPAVTQKDLAGTERLRQIKDLRGRKGPSVSDEMESLRLKAIREVGERVGFQEGYIWRYKQIEKVLRNRELALDSIFDFGPFMLSGGKAVPPVITTADSYMEIKDPNEMVSTGKSYKILKPARFVTVKPSWRDYLLVPEGAVRVEKIHPAMLPVNSEERDVWRESIDGQWRNGIEHADKMFEIGVSKLLVDLRGMIQYKVLESRGYISMPQIATGHLSIRVGDENLEFNQETFRITEKARFKDAGKPVKSGKGKR